MLKYLCLYILQTPYHLTTVQMFYFLYCVVLTSECSLMLLWLVILLLMFVITITVFLPGCSPLPLFLHYIRLLRISHILILVVLNAFTDMAYVTSPALHVLLSCSTIPPLGSISRSLFALSLIELSQNSFYIQISLVQSCC